MRKRRAVALQLECFLFALEVHGTSAAYERRHIRLLRYLENNWWHGFGQARQAIAEAAKRRGAGWGHHPSCACWECILGLLEAVAVHRAEMQARAEMETAGTVFSCLDSGIGAG